MKVDSSPDSYIGSVAGGPQKVAEKPAAAWTAEQTVDFMMASLERGDFYILCPDNDVPRRLDEKRMLWAAGDIVEVNSAQLLYAYKRGVHTPFVADLNHRIRFTDGVAKLERKVVRLINSTDSLSALGFLL